MDTEFTQKKELKKKSRRVTWEKKVNPSYKEIMEKYYYCCYKPPNAVVKQQIWQQKQYRN